MNFLKKYLDTSKVNMYTRFNIFSIQKVMKGNLYMLKASREPGKLKTGAGLCISYSPLNR